MVGEEVGDEVVFGGVVGVDFGEEDFGHVGEAFCEYFYRLALFVRIVKVLALEYLCDHAKTDFVGDPCRFVCESFKCRALPSALCRLQGDGDSALVRGRCPKELEVTSKVT